ncbi:TIGR04222 domain-containing membrane protein [Nocardia sp. SYP-A9097]|uniref:TIGR04222 domain-containing membrane protein n=1 Tax=Nocardia sp. SYP-A9097 TaxID=2663237 RepID=UPI00129B74D4|nr:TIGR04222 domain-containing membrane protein [Nocardia sp. SYP-A9097]MRH86494.1 TIGR04222 domain-containing membrane protein [Nocardia sp. SYP-A9097]
MVPRTTLAAAHSPATADTWGIPGPTFLIAYVLLGLVAALFGFVQRARIIRADTSRAHLEAALSPTETAMLFDDRRPVLAGLAQLRGYQLVDSTGAATRSPTDTEERQLDPVSRTMHRYLRDSYQRRMPQLVVATREPLTALRHTLTDRGYLIGPEQRKSLLLAALPLIAVLVLGLVRIIAGIANSHSVGYLILCVLVVIICTLVLLRPARLTRRGRVARREAVQRNGHLRPAHAPAYAAYGPDSAALAAALFGATVLWSLDPGLAGATGTLAGTGIGSTGNSCSSSSGDSGSSDSGSSDSGGGSSCGGSSCGGGGCGG